MTRKMVDLGEELVKKIDEIGSSIHFTSRRNIVAYLIRDYEEHRK